MLKRIFIYFLFLLFAVAIKAQNQDEIKNNILNKITSGKFSSAQVGLSVFEGKKEILAYNSNKNFIPASVLKLFYTLSAIDVLGENFRYKTKFYYSGNLLFDGTLEGDIIIYASGDPTFGSKRFYTAGYLTIMKTIFHELKKNNINCIDGDIILIISYKTFPVNGSWTYEDIGNYYGGGYYPFNISENQYTLTFDTGKELNKKVKLVSIEPEIYGLKIKNHVIANNKGSGDNAYIYGEPFDYNIEIKGTLPVGEKKYKIKGAMPNPPETFMYMISDYLEDNDIYHQNLKIMEHYEAEKKLLFDITSPSLLDIVKKCNDYSINLYSEALAHLLCNKKKHPSEYILENEIDDFFNRYKINNEHFRIVDGCGLSSDNLISPKTINIFVNDMIDKLGIKKTLDILPKAGQDGYAKNIFEKQINIWLKSGSISGVLNYSGIIKTKRGKYLTFSIMVNNILYKNKITIKKTILDIILQLSKL